MVWGPDTRARLLCRAEAAGLKWQVDQAARNLETEKRRGEALARERESLAKLRAQAENATHTQVRRTAQLAIASTSVLPRAHRRKLSACLQCVCSLPCSRQSLQKAFGCGQRRMACNR